jgi:glutamate-1-semialdehyde 2,1-aminomutase
MCIGHANPTVGEAVKARHEEGTHFAAPTNGSIVVAENLRERFGLPSGGSPTPVPSRRCPRSTWRGATERDHIIKVEGSYDGHHDAVMVSATELDELGPRESPNPIPFGSGYPQALVDSLARSRSTTRRSSSESSRSTREGSPG